MNSPNPVTDILFFHFFKPWCWMLLCLGSVVWTVAIEAHWLLQAETKRQMVVVCVVYCDCYLTVQFYLQLEVCVWVCVHVWNRAHSFTSTRICAMTEKEMQSTSVHNRHFPLSPADGNPHSLNRREKHRSTRSTQLLHIPNNAAI